MLVSAIHQHESGTGTHMKIILLYSSIDLMQCLSKSQLAFCLEIEEIVLKFICFAARTGFNPWWGNKNLTSFMAEPKKKLKHFSRKIGTGGGECQDFFFPKGRN